MSHRFVCWLLVGWLLVGGAAAARDQKEKAPVKDPITPREIRVPGYINQAVYSPDGALLAAGCEAAIVVYNVQSGKLVMRMQLPDKHSHHSLAFALDGKSIVWCSNYDPMVRVFDLKTGRQTREFAQPDHYKKERENAIAQGRRAEPFSSSFLAFSPDGSKMAYYGRWKGLDIMDVATGKLTQTIDDPEWARGCAFSRDNKRIVCILRDSGLRVYDGETGKLVQAIKGNARKEGDKSDARSATDYASFSPDGNFLASWGHQPSSLDVWEVQTGKRICTISAAIYFMTAEFSRDNQSILCQTTWGETMLHNIVAEKTVLRLTDADRYAQFARFSPDQKQIMLVGRASGARIGEYSIYLFDVPAKLLDPLEARIDDVELEKLWADLLTENAFRLQLVQKAFRAAPKQAVALFRKHLQPIAKERQKQVEALIAELDDADFTRRDRAMKDLQAVAHDFAPLLEARHKSEAAGEIRNRLTFAIKQMQKEETPRSIVRERRVLALLQELATPDARALVGELAQGAALARLTVEAQAALNSMSTKKSTCLP